MKSNKSKGSPSVSSCSSEDDQKDSCDKLFRIPGETLLIKVSNKEKLFRKKLYPSIEKVKEEKLVCTVCAKIVGPFIFRGLSYNLHSALGLLVCKDCQNFYGDGNFSVDEDGDEKYCRWCAQGGKLFLCDKCNCSFCKRCVKNNLSRDVLKEMEESDKWKCFICKPKPLYKLRAQAWAAHNIFLRETKNKAKKLSNSHPISREKKIRSKTYDSANESTTSQSSSLSEADGKRKCVKVGYRFLKALMKDFSEFSVDVLSRVSIIQNEHLKKSAINSTDDVFKMADKLEKFFGSIQVSLSDFKNRLIDNRNAFKTTVTNVKSYAINSTKNINDTSSETELIKNNTGRKESREHNLDSESDVEKENKKRKIENNLDSESDIEKENKKRKLENNVDSESDIEKENKKRISENEDVSLVGNDVMDKIISVDIDKVVDDSSVNLEETDLFSTVPIEDTVDEEKIVNDLDNSAVEALLKPSSSSDEDNSICHGAAINDDKKLEDKTKIYSSSNSDSIDIDSILEKSSSSTKGKKFTKKIKKREKLEEDSEDDKLEEEKAKNTSLNEKITLPTDSDEEFNRLTNLNTLNKTQKIAQIEDSSSCDDVQSKIKDKEEDNSTDNNVRDDKDVDNKEEVDGCKSDSKNVGDSDRSKKSEKKKENILDCLKDASESSDTDFKEGL